MVAFNLCNRVAKSLIDGYSESDFWYHILGSSMCIDVSDNGDTRCLVSLGHVLSTTLSTSHLFHCVLKRGVDLL